MSQDMILVLIILLAAVGLFVSDRLRVDLVGLLVLIAAVIAGLVTPQEALSGFSNPAVVTVGAVFVLSAGLSKTGVASWIGRQILKVAGKGEVQLTALIMITAAVLSGFMNNVGVAALFLPMVMEMARRTGHSSSRLFMPLSFGCLLGGLITLLMHAPRSGIEKIQDNPDFKLLETDTADLFSVHERLMCLRVPQDSDLVSKSLEESGFGKAFALTVVGIIRGEQLLWRRINPSGSKREIRYWSRESARTWQCCMAWKTLK